jgi:phage-related protein
VRRRWRLYKTDAGRSPVREYLGDLTAGERAEIASAMGLIAVRGLESARHLRGDVYEVRVASDGRAFRILFAAEGQRSQILLAVEAFEKKSRQTPGDISSLRSADWTIGEVVPGLEACVDIFYLR